MRSLHLSCELNNNNRILGEVLVPLKCIKPPSSVGCCPFYGGSSIAVDSLFIVGPIVSGGSGIRESPAQFENRIKPLVHVRRIERITLCTKKLHFVSRKKRKVN